MPTHHQTGLHMHCLSYQTGLHMHCLSSHFEPGQGLLTPRPGRNCTQIWCIASPAVITVSNTAGFKDTIGITLQITAISLENFQIGKTVRMLRTNCSDNMMRGSNIQRTEQASTISPTFERKKWQDTVNSPLLDTFPRQRCCWMPCQCPWYRIHNPVLAPQSLK
jgi:hypothetical protein